MRKYVHWLKLDWSCGNKERQDINNFHKEYPNATIEIYPYKYNFDRAIKITCEQSYQDLDLDVNSMSTNLIRLTQKPKDIQENGIDFELWYNKVNKRLDEGEERE